MLLLLVVGCSAPAGYRELADDEIDARDVVLPAGARAGESITWSITQSDVEDSDAVEETVACVERTAERVTIEWRTTRNDGRREVVAARFRPDGTLLGAWRGPADGVGARLNVVAWEVDLEQAREEADRHGKAVGVSTDDVRVDTETATEEVETPAGRFRCERQTMKGSLLFVSMRGDYWFAGEGVLPLHRLVKIRVKGPMGYRFDQVLAAYGTTGARPTLRLP